MRPVSPEIRMESFFDLILVFPDSLVVVVVWEEEEKIIL